MKVNLKVVLPLAMVAVGIVGAVAMIKARSAPKPRPSNAPVPLVRVMSVNKQDLQIKVSTQGTVSPRTESALVPEVSGRVVAISPALAAGGFFERNEVLLEIDSRDYELEVTRFEAQVARERVNYESEKAEADVARKEWERLGNGEASPLTLRVPQLRQAEASYQAAVAALEKAKLDLERTKVRAPFLGRVKEKRVDVGQFVQRGAPVATVYAVDLAEVRLPLPVDQIAYLELPLHYPGEGIQQGPETDFFATFGGRRYQWSGHVVRTEGQIDPKTRMVYAVAQVENPYGIGESAERPPMAPGLFVEAEVHGKLYRDVIVLPRAALRGRDRVLVVDEENRMHYRTVGILRTERQEVLVDDGLEDGEVVCISPLEAVVEGMKVRTLHQGELSAPEAQTEITP